MRLINFAHGELIMIAGYALLRALRRSRSPLMLIGGALVAAVLLALATERVAFRPLRDADPATLLISSFAVSFFLEKTLILFVGSRPKGIDFLPELGRPGRDRRRAAAEPADRHHPRQRRPARRH